MKNVLTVILITLLSINANALNCDGKIKAVLTSNNYCENSRVGFMWEASSKWLCSVNEQMDSMLMAALISKINVSVRDYDWETCESPENGDTPHHIWFFGDANS